MKLPAFLELTLLLDRRPRQLSRRATPTGGDGAGIGAGAKGVFV